MIRKGKRGRRGKAAGGEAGGRGGSLPVKMICNQLPSTTIESKLPTKL